MPALPVPARRTGPARARAAGHRAGSGPALSIASRGRGSGAFTLLELLIALVVVAVLAALAVPTYQRVVVGAQDATTQRTLEAVYREAGALATERGHGSPTSADFTDAAADTYTAAAASAGVSAAGTPLALVVDSPSTGYGTLAFHDGTDAAGFVGLSMLSKAGHCVLARSASPAAVQSWVDTTLAPAMCTGASAVSGPAATATGVTGTTGQVASTGGSALPSPTPSPTCNPAPSPMLGCEPAGTASATSSYGPGMTADKAVDLSTGSYWDSGQTVGQWQEVFTAPTAFNAVSLETGNDTSGYETFTVYGRVSGTWTKIGTKSVSVSAAGWPAPTGVNVAVTSGTYTGVRIAVSSSSIYSVLVEVSVATADIPADPPVPVTGGGASCTPVPSPMPGCSVVGTVAASADTSTYPARYGNDGALSTFWDGGNPHSWWQVTFANPSTVNSVTVASVSDTAGSLSYTVYGLVGGSWVQVGTGGPATMPASLTTRVYTTIPVAAGVYDGVKIQVDSANLYSTLSEVSVS